MKNQYNSNNLTNEKAIHGNDLL